jgi:hypothetical protein
MSKNTVTLIRKQADPFEVNYPFALPEGKLTHFDWTGTKNGIISKRDVPVEVFQWLKDFTTTFTNGHLIVEEKDNEELEEDVKYLVEDVEEKQSEIKGAIKTREEIEKMLTTGNQLVLKKELDKLVKDITDEDQVKEVKSYIYRTAIDIGVDSNAKRKVICEWYGLSNVENCGWIFDEETK